MSTTDLDAFLGAGTNRKGCPVCGEKNVVNIIVQIRELGKNGQAVGGRTKATARSMCAEHGIEAWQEAAAQLTGNAS